MAPEYQELNDEQGESPTDEKESSGAFSSDSVHDLPSTGSHGQTNRAWFHFRLRTFVLLLLGVPLCGWFVCLLIQSGDNDPFDESLIWMVLALLLVWCPSPPSFAPHPDFSNPLPRLLLEWTRGLR
jgi:hypothetical protein